MTKHPDWHKSQQASFNITLWHQYTRTPPLCGLTDDRPHQPNYLVLLIPTSRKHPREHLDYLPMGKKNSKPPFDEPFGFLDGPGCLLFINEVIHVSEFTTLPGQWFFGPFCAMPPLPCVLSSRFLKVLLKHKSALGKHFTTASATYRTSILLSSTTRRQIGLVDLNFPHRSMQSRLNDFQTTHRCFRELERNGPFPN